MTETENVGNDICDLFGRKDQIRHLRMRGREEHPQGGRGHTTGIGDVAESRSDNDAS